MTLQYIHHSCFAWEGPRTVIVYDYWRDNADQRLLQLLTETQKQIYFVVSHFHEDHYNPDQLKWFRNKENPPRLLLSHDVVKRRRVDKNLPTAILRPDDIYDDEFISLKAYRSTDVGISTFIMLKEEEEESCFHAGDLNNWYFPEGDDRLHILVHEMEGMYLSILRDIQLDHPCITHSLIPIDPRLGKEMLRGSTQWLTRIETKHFYPMHTWGQHDIVIEQIEQLKYLFPHTEFHYEADPEAIDTYGDFLKKVQGELDAAANGELEKQSESETENNTIQ